MPSAGRRPSQCARVSDAALELGSAVHTEFRWASTRSFIPRGGHSSGLCQVSGRVRRSLKAPSSWFRACTGHRVLGLARLGSLSLRTKTAGACLHVVASPQAEGGLLAGRLGSSRRWKRRPGPQCRGHSRLFALPGEGGARCLFIIGFGFSPR